MSAASSWITFALSGTELKWNGDGESVAIFVKSEMKSRLFSLHLFFLQSLSLMSQLEVATKAGNSDWRLQKNSLKAGYLKDCLPWIGERRV